jgi:hypothetical protein
LEADTGSTIVLAWQVSYSQVSSSTTVLAIQDLTTNDIILDKPVSIPSLVKESSSSSRVNGNINIDKPVMLKSRTSSRIKKAPGRVTF